ncbi:endonuclease NucS domain-containing protein [Acanthopleuribacter pedis]|uniref:DUF91 domain-containing protein n=1 Tax=Acanthopleuribacter pedis TaxID=442870 RepID=A0A8J7U605_9BACT|nr:endonuclease NucS domain-containing protein [Acanthopleuribacter pedis]MBO1321389.1 DUF91 domain-containing protein [Acanthopleuribacter pedis]
MSNLKLFSLQSGSAVELIGGSARLEKDLQACVERNMKTLLGVHFLASEYQTTHGGKMDSLGLDENNCPVIIEYKKNQNQNVINQGLFYLDWLVDHKAAFQLLVSEKLGAEAASLIDWTGVRLILIAQDYNRYDRHAVNQIDRSIDLFRYSFHQADGQGGPFLLLDLIGSQPSTARRSPARTAAEMEPVVRNDSHQAQLGKASPELKALYDDVCEFANSLGDVQQKELKYHIAFKNITNFACVVVKATQDPRVRLFLKLDPNEVELEEGFTEDMTGIGHWGTGDLSVTLRNKDDFKKAKQLIEASFQAN